MGSATRLLQSVLLLCVVLALHMPGQVSHYWGTSSPLPALEFSQPVQQVPNRGSAPLEGDKSFIPESASHATRTIPPGLDEVFVRRLANECATVDVGTLRDILAIAWSICQEEGYHYTRLIAQMRAESDFNPKLVSSAGAIGLMQIMPATGRFLGFSKLHSVEENIRCGVRYMKYLERFTQVHDSAREKWLATLACYNSGPGHYSDLLARTQRRYGSYDWTYVSKTYRRRFRRARGQRLPETLIYIRRNLDTLERLHANLFETWNLDEPDSSAISTHVRAPWDRITPVLSAD